MLRERMDDGSFLDFWEVIVIYTGPNGEKVSNRILVTATQDRLSLDMETVEQEAVRCVRGVREKVKREVTGAA